MKKSLFFRSLSLIIDDGASQSTSYNVAHPACSLQGSIHLSPVHAYEFVSRCRFSTPTPRLMIELFVLTSSHFPLRKSEYSYTPAETRTHKFRLDQGGSPGIDMPSEPTAPQKRFWDRASSRDLAIEHSVFSSEELIFYPATPN